MMTQTMRTTLRHFLLLALVALFVMLGGHFSMAQEGGQEIPLDNPETPAEETNEVETTDTEIPAEEGEVLGEDTETPVETPEEEQVPAELPPPVETPVEPEPTPEPAEEVQEPTTPEPEPEPEPTPEPQPEPVAEEIYEEIIEEEEEIVIPFMLPKNLPEFPAFPHVREFYTDPEATHACWVRDFVVDMKFDPTKNNVIYINNSSVGPSNIEVVGLPSGFQAVFGNKSKTIAIPSGTKELPFTIEKKGRPQKGSFNVVFVFTKKGGGESVTTCQMNLTN